MRLAKTFVGGLALMLALANPAGALTSTSGPVQVEKTRSGRWMPTEQPCDTANASGVQHQDRAGSCYLRLP